MKNMALTLGLAVLFAIGSGLVEQAAFLDPEGTFVRWSTGIAAKLFTLSALLVFMCGMQWQRRHALTQRGQSAVLVYRAELM